MYTIRRVGQKPVSYTAMGISKVLGDFGSKYIKIRPTKDRRNDPVPRNKFNRKQENNAIVNSTEG